MSESKVGFAVLFVAGLIVLVVVFAYGGLNGLQAWLQAQLFASPQLACQAVMTQEPGSGMFALFFLLIGGGASMAIIKRPESSGRILWSKAFAWLFVSLVFLLAGSAGVIAKLSLEPTVGEAIRSTITTLYVISGCFLAFALWLRFSASRG